MTENKGFKKDGKIVTLCGGGNCCPKINFEDPNNIVFTDDHGGAVQLTADQFAGLKNYFNDSGPIE
ncbi:TPA: hypothetical protein DEP58_04405 [Patescibacteria group bacterium]|nr:MAG: hypothetical protein UU98_C0023G0001 [Parcubacteria group bacterium GW2011_GWD2_42_14]HCC05511.1 hypothetical protein [Patescibacteria group bacterium]